LDAKDQKYNKQGGRGRRNGSMQKKVQKMKRHAARDGSEWRRRRRRRRRRKKRRKRRRRRRRRMWSGVKDVVQVKKEI
jgi:hypothetical protein